MINRGDLKYLFELHEYYITDEVDELGEKIRKTKKITEAFAKIESRIGSLLSGNRPADTVLQKTTMKLTTVLDNLPEILPRTHFLIINNKRYEIDYTLDNNTGFIEIFCHEKI